MKVLLFIFITFSITDTFADMVIGLNGSYSQFADKQSQDYGFSPRGVGYGIELGFRTGAFRLTGGLTKSSLRDDIIHDSTSGEFTLNSMAYTIAIDTLITSRLFFGIGYGFWSTKSDLTGEYDSESSKGAFDRYFLSEQSSSNGLLLRLGYKFLRTKKWSTSIVFQRNLYNDNANENKILLNFRIFFTVPKLGNTSSY